jgi:hypothetical protein
MLSSGLGWTEAALISYSLPVVIFLGKGLLRILRTNQQGFIKTLLAHGSVISSVHPSEGSISSGSVGASFTEGKIKAREDWREGKSCHCIIVVIEGPE